MRIKRTRKSVMFAFRLLALVVGVSSCGRRPEAAKPDAGRDYIAEFRRLTGTNHVSCSFDDTAKLCRDITESASRQEAIRLLETLMDMTVSQPLAEIGYRRVFMGRRPNQNNEPVAQYARIPDYSEREMHLERLWEVTRASFLASQALRPGDYAVWDGLFAFYGKCTDEIGPMGEASFDVPRDGTAARDRKPDGYIRFVKSELKQYIHVMRYFEVERPDGLAANLTESQRAELLKRFAEIEAFTLPQPDCPGDCGPND